MPFLITIVKRATRVKPVSNLPLSDLMTHTSILKDSIGTKASADIKSFHCTRLSSAGKKIRIDFIFLTLEKCRIGLSCCENLYEKVWEPQSNYTIMGHKSSKVSTSVRSWKILSITFHRFTCNIHIPSCCWNNVTLLSNFCLPIRSTQRQPVRNCSEMSVFPAGLCELGGGGDGASCCWTSSSCLVPVWWKKKPA